MKNSSQIIVRLGVESISCDRSITLQKKQEANKGIFILLDGKEAYIADPVMKLVADRYESCRLDGEHFNRLMECIDDSGSERPMVPAQRVGAGPTEKSARFKIDVLQKVSDGTREGKQNSTTLIFTLPVSQIEDVGEGQLAAPLWLILEKLQQKSSNQWGKKHRQDNSIASEFVPAPLRATTSPRVIALKEWLNIVRVELLLEEENKNQFREKENEENAKIAADIFAEIPLDAPSNAIMKIFIEMMRGSDFEMSRKDRISHLVSKLFRESRQERPNG